jgi:hypothetical protein
LFFPFVLNFDDLWTGGPLRFMERCGTAPELLADDGIRTRAAAVELAHMLWREGAEGIHRPWFHDGEMWWLNVQAYERALAIVRSGKINWAAAARSITSATVELPSGGRLKARPATTGAVCARMPNGEP